MQNQNFVEKYSDRIMVEQMLADLIPGFLRNKTNDLKILNQAIIDQDYNQIKKIGHNWKGACSSYGFHYLGEVGQQFEELATDKNKDKLKVLIDSLPEYFNNIQVDYDSGSNDSNS